jgi:CheY-like chemotaxis protein
MSNLFSGRHILVVEDDMHIRMTIQDILVDLGCEPVTVIATADKAIAFIERHEVDAAVLDMNLQGISSRSVADALAARGIPFVVATGNRGGVWEGVHDRPVLRKPFKYAQLVEVLTQLLPR